MRLRCVAVRDETADVRTWVFEDETGAPTAFCAGQAITLALPVNGETLHRTFSIASSSTRSQQLEVTVKAPLTGRATQWMRLALQPGMIVEGTGPHGCFRLPDSYGPLALISAGSGATPLMAMLRTLAHTDSAAEIAWVHAARAPTDVLFGAELAAAQLTMPRLSVSVAVTQAGPGWFGYRGRLSRRLLSVMVPDLASRDVLCCGPRGFMDEVRRIHAAEGGDAARFRVEHFGDVAAPQPAPLAGDACGDAYSESYTIAYGNRSFAAFPSETILQAASRSNVVIPCGCGGGMCGTCRVRLATGRVEMNHRGGLQPEEETDGWILACSAKPRSDLLLTP